MSLPLLRSVLYAPANRPDLIAKMPRYGADAVVVDLEDGTPLGAKQQARAMAVEAAADLRGRYEGSIWLRVNSPSTEFFADDLVVLRDGPFDGLNLPKVEHPDQIRDLEAGLQDLGVGDTPLMIGIETVAGVHRVHDLLGAAPRAVAAYFGAEDFVADLGGRRSVASLETLYARTRVAMACRLAGLVPIDQVVLALTDATAFREDAAVGQDLGYRGKTCIHPAQVKLCHETYTPGPDAVDRATRLLECYEAALRQGRGTADFEGQMIDTPMVTQARNVLQLAALAATN